MSDKKSNFQSQFFRHTRLSKDCIEWSCCLNEAGYGIFRYKGVSRLAHRISYEITTGEIGNLCVLHHIYKYKISPAVISQIINNKWWRHV